MIITNNYICNKFILLFLLLNLIFVFSNNGIGFVKSQSSSLSFINAINGSLDKPNLVYASSVSCSLSLDFNLSSNAVPVGLSSDGYIFTPNSKDTFYRLFIENLPIGKSTLNLTINIQNTIYTVPIPYSCILFEYSKVQFKIISKLFNHHQQYKATFQIINSIIANIPIEILEYKCAGECKLIKINSNTFDIIFYQVPTNYQDPWVLEFGSDLNSYSLSFDSPYKVYNKIEIASVSLPNQEIFQPYGQHQVHRYRYSYSDNSSLFYIPPAIKMLYTVSDAYDIVRKPKMVDIIDNKINFEGKTVARLDVTQFSLQYNIESDTDLLQFYLTQNNFIAGPSLSQVTSQGNGKVYSIEYTSTQLDYNLRFLNIFLNEDIGVYYQLEYNVEAPFGITHLDLSTYTFSIKASIPIHSMSTFEVAFDNSRMGGWIYYTPNDGISPEVNYLKIHNVEWYTLDQGYFILRVNVSDLYGLRLLRLTSNSYGNSFLTQGTIDNGIFEYKFSYLDNLINFGTTDGAPSFTLSITNGIVSFEQMIPYNEIISISPKVTRFLADPLLESLRDYDIGSNIKNISFLNNKMNVTNQDGWNLMFLEFKDTVQNYEPMLSIIKDVTEESYFDNGDFDTTDTSVQYYYGKWNKDYNMYIIEFYVPRNIKAGYLAYSLSVTYNKFSIVYNQDLSSDYQLTIISTLTDFSGPIISNIIINEKKIYDADYDIFGWNLTVSDSINGFKNGYIVVRGLRDYSVYNITLSEDTIVQGDVYSGTHQIEILTPAGNCGYEPPSLSQTHDFQIFEILLVDRGDNIAHFKVQGELNKLAYTDPISQLVSKESLIYSYQCSFLDTQAWEAPSISSFVVTPSYLNVFSSNERELKFIIRVQCQSLINEKSLPIVYLSTLLNQNIIKVQLSLINCTVSLMDCYFGGEYLVPYGFGYPDGIYYSVYGVLSGRSGITGISSFDSGKFINTSLSNTTLPIITSTGQITTNGGSLRIEGLALHNTKSVLITFSDSSNQTISPSKVLSTSLMVLNIKATKNPFTIKVISNTRNVESNSFTVIPITTIDIPVNINTPKPVSCPKDKNGSICSSNGECINGQCVCRSPWIGNDCASQVIIIPQPEPSTEEPSTIIVVEEDDILKSIISVVQLRELDINRIPIKIFTFESWKRTNLSTSSYQYISTVNNNNINTMVNVTLQWFENSTTIEFANEKFEMNPSTLKYTITIGHYSFESTLNTLQLIMSSSVSSNANDCSYKEFNNQTSSDYLKLEIKSKSLYARYIKRCILDDVKIISISNDLLDKDLNLTSKNDNNNLQSYIGINIPQFKDKAVIDPDFSVLSNYNRDKQGDGETFCKGNVKKGLSGLNIFGICLGGFFAVVGAVLCYLYIKNKKKNRKKFLDKLRQTELSMRNSTTTSTTQPITVDIEKH